MTPEPVILVSGADSGDLVITRDTCLIWLVSHTKRTRSMFIHFFLYRHAILSYNFSRTIAVPISGADLGDLVITRNAINLHSLGTRQTLSVGRPNSNPPDIIPVGRPSISIGDYKHEL